MFFDEVGPDLYRENAFRITGLPVHATARDMRRRSEELRVMERLGVGSGGTHLLPLEPPPDAVVAQDAMQRLRDPIRRLEEEFFWFWPSEEGPDEALEALRRGDTDAAETAWQRRSADSAAPDAVHNLAVLAHVRALDPPTPDSRLWERAFARWRAVIADDAVWGLLGMRIQKLADPRLDSATNLPAMRDGLPAALLSINAQLAVRAARAGQDARAYAGLIHGSGFDRDTIDDVLRRTVEPDTARLRSLGETTVRAVDSDLAAAKEPIARFLDQATALLAIPESVLPRDHPILLGARDEVASQAIRCAVPYVNKTDDWRTARDVLERALPIAATGPVRARIEENLETVRGALVYRTCVFCAENPADEASVIAQKMYGNTQHRHVSMNQIRTTWQTGTINVPRCATCAAAQKRRKSGVWRVGCSTNIVLLAIAIGLLIAGLSGVGIALAAVDVIVFVVVAGLAGRDLSNEDMRKLHGFEPIAAALRDGWRFGERPPNTS